MLPLKSISPSRIKTFDSCKFKYWLNYHRPDISFKSNWGAEHGSLIHDILENYVNGTDTDWMARLYRGYAGVLKTKDRYGKDCVFPSPLKYAKPDEFARKKPFCDTCPMAKNGICKISGESLKELSGCPKSLFEQSIYMIEKVIERYEENNIWGRVLKDRETGGIIGCEYPFNIKVPGTEVPMIGIIDLVVEEDEETIHVMDYKSGSWTQDFDDCLKDIQVRMYSLAARKEFIEDINEKGYSYKNVILTFDYFKDQPVTLAFTEEEDKQTEREVRDKIREIQSVDKVTRILRDGDSFSDRKYWQCRSLCDTRICEREWTGAFNV